AAAREQFSGRNRREQAHNDGKRPLAGSFPMKILVTGGAGFIGSNFIRHVLANKDYAVVNYDKLTYAGNLSNLKSVAANPRYEFVKGDICDAAAVEAAMTGCDAVVHFAAESHVDRSIYEPAASIETNVKGTFVLLQVARKLNVARFLHISTDEVYGDMQPGAFADENSPIRPSSPYSSSKAGSDLLVLSYVRTYGFPALITRSSNNYGPYQFPEKFLPLMITNLLGDKPLPIYGDGLQQRDWLHVEDNCRGIVAVLERGRIGEVYNIGGLDIVDNLVMARKLLAAMGKPESLLTYVKDRPGHDRRYALRCDKIERELGWKAEVPLEEGLRQTIDWYKDNRDWVAGIRDGEYRLYYEKYYENRDSSLDDIQSSAKLRQ
ncbi:MAG TPA: dTDP-glucose 4,6-dehydratase, partial [Candidatus Aquilonibacter sp.]|nr:dTDP-glucose 4,6-dehydratase [Candidatus Aquilonibacter sp.]